MSFVMEKNIPVPGDFADVLCEIGVQYGKDLDSNAYFSRYGSLLNSAEKNSVSPHQLLEILQGLYHHLNSFLQPREIRESLLKPLASRDTRILEYMAGYMLRKHYTSVKLRRLLKSLYNI